VPLFGVLQKALHNVIEHSGLRQAEVQLRVDSGEIHLIVSDLGKGYDVKAALAGKGLGLTGMRERVRRTIVIESKPLVEPLSMFMCPLGWSTVLRRLGENFR